MCFHCGFYVCTTLFQYRATSGKLLFLGSFGPPDASARFGARQRTLGPAPVHFGRDPRSRGHTLDVAGPHFGRRGATLWTSRGHTLDKRGTDSVSTNPLRHPMATNSGDYWREYRARRKECCDTISKERAALEHEVQRLRAAHMNMVVQNVKLRLTGQDKMCVLGPTHAIATALSMAENQHRHPPPAPPTLPCLPQLCHTKDVCRAISSRMVTAEGVPAHERWW
jgi:hypothetical protein